MKKISSTTKKVKIMNQQEYINAKTGETHKMNTISIEEKDFDFNKLWLKNIACSLELIGNSKTTVMYWILNNLNSDNILIATQQQVAEKSNVGIVTVIKTFKILVESDFLIKVANGVYRINPNIIFKGSSAKRGYILIKYNEEKSRDDTDKTREEMKHGKHSNW